MASSLHRPAPLLRFNPKAPTFCHGFHPRLPSRVLCGLRDGPRKPLWRGRILSTEAIQAVQALKLAKSSSSPSLDQVFQSRIGRLLKADLISVLAELRRQHEWDLALQVFGFIRTEVWYKPDLSLYSDMIMMFGKKKMIETAEQLFSEIEKEGIKPDTRAYTEMIGAFLRVGMVEKAMDLYKSMKEEGCNPDKLTLVILIRNLEKAGAQDLACSVRRDCEKYIDEPEKFLSEVYTKFPKRRSFKVV
ncbi:protein THYLAKOID ASSEMBLY 8-like, chloroplastic isoform X1 [Dioscorea cayenensis subsp. rotundata]|uniref:Protein THYLAKOID ASSEMBLY 8-like, chloroplastic isoform X1 n=1 Tax=Dioscorea cayennensis subsp. rotundata TaxID=55577 RepID=A0AB40BF83_DIOCR|nr:protein THYLAKOID ASSEMBLY 8-like, chloroplastic isoform X1 [Dioscorea cayenensis subsp. rotundata]